ncbi:leukemia inhibitory factor receptor isoform X1 [Amblyraja radiata]|uniref:leukemia inhibitory factor receptor isoform X1 n=1 Tax=Amblyraja radiata TaxID=386614 RepID=UPI0014037EB2|nr:leukemia inhibitory factor receptor isoform X1 [Amblyraja radiata]
MDDFSMNTFKAGRMKLCVVFQLVLLTLSLSGCDLALALNHDPCGSISAKVLVAHVGSSHNITCSFCKEGTADKVQWKYGGNELPSSQIIKIGSNASMAMLINLALTSSKGGNLTCMTEEESYTVLIQTGYPPDAPRDMKCVTHNFTKLNCSWDRGRDTNIETNYICCCHFISRSPNCAQVGQVNFIESEFLLFNDRILQITATNELGTQTSEKFTVKESDIAFVPYTPKLKRVFKDPSNSQMMQVEWFEEGDTYGMDLKMIFQIQVLLAYDMQEVSVGNHSETLNYTHNRVLHTTWTSDMPLKCTSYLVRIRSIGNDEKTLFMGRKAWSEWSSPLKLEGQDVSNETSLKIYPVEGTVLEAGSNPAFCCVAGKGEHAETLTFDNLTSFIKLSDRSLAIRVPNVSPSIESGTNVVCKMSGEKYDGAVIFIGYPPDAPKNVSCETRDLQTLNCTWDPGRSTRLVSKRRTFYHLNTGSQNSLLCKEASQVYPDYWCAYPISNISGKTNITIHGKNPLGEAESSITVYVTRVFRPFAPYEWKREEVTRDSVTVSWSDRVDYTGIDLDCEIVIHDNLGKTMTLNRSVTGKGMNQWHTMTLTDLRPNTEYSIRARYSSVLFWKWSKWSDVAHAKTKIAPPSVKLDVWRTVMPNRTVTTYWKPLSALEANGPVLFYNVTWTKVGNGSINSNVEHGTDVQIHLDRAGYVITIVAQNAAGVSPPSVIKIPPQQDDENLGIERATGVGDGINVTWRGHLADNCGYTVQWCRLLSLPMCKVDWSKFPPDTTSATIKSDAFQVGVRYSLEVFECRSDGDHVLKKLIGYTRELAPAEGPQVEVNQTSVESVQIEWKDIPVEKQRGFVEGFKIYYSTLYNDSAASKPMTAVNQQAKIVLRPDQRAFKILGLEAGTTYNVGVRAFTKGGDGPSNMVTVTTPNSPIALILGITLPLIGFVVLGVVLSIFCYQKQEWIKDTFYPDIPDPTNSKVLQNGSFDQVVNLCKTLEPKDCTPNEVQVVEDKQRRAEGNKYIMTNQQGEDNSDSELQEGGVISYRPSSTSVETVGEPNPAFEAVAAVVPCVYPSEVTYTSIRGPGPAHQDRAGAVQLEDGMEVIVKSGYQPQVHVATNPVLDREQLDPAPHVNGYQPQMHKKSWSLDSGNLPTLEPESIGSPTSINSQAFLLPEMFGEELKVGGSKTWSLPFFNARTSSNPYSDDNLS